MRDFLIENLACQSKEWDISRPDLVASVGERWSQGTCTTHTRDQQPNTNNILESTSLGVGPYQVNNKFGSC